MCSFFNFIDHDIKNFSMALMEFLIQFSTFAGTVSKIKSMWQSGEVYNQSSNVKEKDSSYKKGMCNGLTAYD